MLSGRMIFNNGLKLFVISQEYSMLAQANRDHSFWFISHPTLINDTLPWGDKLFYRAIFMHSSTHTFARGFIASAQNNVVMLPEHCILSVLDCISVFFASCWSGNIVFWKISFEFLLQLHYFSEVWMPISLMNYVVKAVFHCPVWIFVFWLFSLVGMLVLVWTRIMLSFNSSAVDPQDFQTWLRMVLFEIVQIFCSDVNMYIVMVACVMYLNTVYITNTHWVQHQQPCWKDHNRGHTFHHQSSYWALQVHMQCEHLFHSCLYLKVRDNESKLN